MTDLPPTAQHKIDQYLQRYPDDPMPTDHATRLTLTALCAISDQLHHHLTQNQK